jgi:hypothetical protein
MDAPQYVHVDVPSVNIFDWMFDYTYHSDMDAHQYVHAYVPSGNLFCWMFCYTYHSEPQIPRYIEPVGLQCLVPYIFHYTQPVEKKTGDHITIFKRGTRDNENRHVSQFNNYTTQLVPYINSIMHYHYNVLCPVNSTPTKCTNCCHKATSQCCQITDILQSSFEDLPQANPPLTTSYRHIGQ